MSSASVSMICIASPVRRSGTTLVQRLLCSSSNSIIFGESVANDLNILSHLISSKKLMLSNNKSWRDKQFNAVLNKNVNNWIPDLHPKIDDYLSGYEESLTSLIKFLDITAKEYKRPTWGVKLPEWNVSSLMILKKMMPLTKVIYLHRNLVDCVKSAKSIDMVRGISEIKQFAHTWAQNEQMANSYLTDNKVLHIKFKDLLADQESWLEQIQQFTGITDINPKVFDTKVNTYAEDEKLKGSPVAYLEPSELNQKELDVISTFY